MLPHYGMLLKVGPVAPRIVPEIAAAGGWFGHSEHQLVGNLASPDLKTALYRSALGVRAAVGIGGMEARE